MARYRTAGSNQLSLAGHTQSYTVPVSLMCDFRWFLKVICLTLGSPLVSLDVPSFLSVLLLCFSRSLHPLTV